MSYKKQTQQGTVSTRVTRQSKASVSAVADSDITEMETDIGNQILSAVEGLGGQLQSTQSALLQSLSEQVNAQRHELTLLQEKVREVDDLKKENESLKFRQSMYESRVERLERTVHEQKEEILDLKCRSMRDNLVFTKIKEKENEKPLDCKDVLFNFLEKEMKIKDAKKVIKNDRVHRMGAKRTGRNAQSRPIVAKFNPYGCKETVLQHAKNLAKKDFGVSEQFPPEIDERRKGLKRRIWEVKEAEKDKDEDDKSKIKLIKDKLFINNELHVDCKRERMVFSEDDVIVSKHIDMVHTESLVDQGSTFQGHAAEITEASQSKAVLLKAFENKCVASAEHNIYAYRVETPSGSIRKYSEDDGEHNAGYKLLKLLQEKELTNVMVVCTRWFGGKHLGKDRFDHIQTVATDALDKLGM